MFMVRSLSLAPRKVIWGQEGFHFNDLDEMDMETQHERQRVYLMQTHLLINYMAHIGQKLTST